jgi:predicted Rossmann fold nucleotide-binding protein DprA/Smf involved in DNA uptake
MGLKNTVTIIGSRDVPRDTARTLFEHQLSPFLSEGRTWLLGGARGIDQWAMEWLLEQNEACCIVLPYTRGHQPQWLHPWLEQVDRVIELQLPKRKTASAIRNRHMVELSQIVFGFWSGKGGLTVKTLKHALRERKEVHAIPVVLRAG